MELNIVLGWAICLASALTGLIWEPSGRGVHAAAVLIQALVAKTAWEEINGEREDDHDE